MRFGGKNIGTMSFSYGARASCADERGMALLGTVLALGLLWASFCLCQRAVAALHSRVAEQSRLDICAVRMTSARKRLLRELVRLNHTIRATQTAIYALRAGRMVAVAGGMLAGLGEAALLKLNKGAALLQHSLVAAATAQETVNSACAATPFSRNVAFCVPNRPASASFVRKESLFPDVMAPLEASTGSRLFAVSCRGPRMVSMLVIEGSPALTREDFRETYRR